MSIASSVSARSRTNGPIRIPPTRRSTTSGKSLRGTNPASSGASDRADRDPEQRGHRCRHRFGLISSGMRRSASHRRLTHHDLSARLSRQSLAKSRQDARRLGKTDYRTRIHGRCMMSREPSRSWTCRPRPSNDLLGLLREVDSAELKLTIPQADHASTVQALELDPLDAQIRQVFFFDTPDLRLDAAGVVVRARRVQGKGDDTVVKLRPVGPAELSAELRAHPDFGVEVDAMPKGKHVCSASFKGTTKKVRETVLAGGPLPQAVHQAATSVLHRARTRRDRAGRPRRARPDLRTQGEVRAGGARTPDRGGVLALPRR